MSWSEMRSQVQIGDAVYGAEGEKVGTISEIQPTYLVVEKGFFFPTDYYVPVSAITSVTGDGVVLNVTKDVALNSGWDIVPEATGTTVRADDRAWAVDAAPLETEVVAADVAPLADARGIGAEPELAAYESTSEDDLVIPLREEELTATVRETEAGAARIEKRVISEERVLEVPVTEEQVRVSRRVVDRPLDASDADAFEEIVIEVPLTREQVELQRQGHVVEEVVVSKDAVQHTEQVRGTVRREEVEVIKDAGTAAVVDETEVRREGGV